MNRIRIGRLVIEGDPSRHAPSVVTRAVEREVLRVLSARGQSQPRAGEIARAVAAQVLARGGRK